MPWSSQGPQPYGNGVNSNYPNSGYNGYGSSAPYSNNSYGQQPQPCYDQYGNQINNNAYNAQPPRPVYDPQPPRPSYDSQNSSQALLTPPAEPQLRRKRSKREMVGKAADTLGKAMIGAGALATPFAVIDPFVTPIVAGSVIAAGTALRTVVYACKKCGKKFRDSAETVPRRIELCSGCY
ncbi:uncharacterized protein BDR25DRAFT_392156 [Lindgomyces ingoldianus]|uniref:Uncharacterized protein n=1 Tax=Lindgomyces ingoldianus TaxID=673940 RepID=A0ACB6R533_9PLEO|nr:uncharacterized protein BDR25DRAFT_392156 [Lindgomyces ingoldianus]KAF2473637.1 hypothetical protein BDR25DRAFT_392156 [Lindgomyces ingoldianus]